MNQQIKTSPGVIIILIVIATVGMFIWQMQKNQPGIPQSITPIVKKACTMEAKLCPDGSSVGRMGANCKFAPCSEGNNSECVKEGESIGAVYPGVMPKKCCEGLTPVIPKNIVGTQGICTKVNNTTADWQTYKNDKYGFEFKYPKDFIVSEAEGTIGLKINDKSKPVDERREIPFVNMEIVNSKKDKLVI
jgi:hypothetical protein